MPTDDPDKAWSGYKFHRPRSSDSDLKTGCDFRELNAPAEIGPDDLFLGILMREYEPTLARRGFEIVLSFDDDDQARKAFGILVQAFEFLRVEK